MLNVYCADSLLFFRSTLSGKKKKTVKPHPELDDPEGDALCLMALENCESPDKLSQESNESTPHRRKRMLLMAPKKPVTGKKVGLNETARRKLFPLPDGSSKMEVVPCDNDGPVHIDFRGKPKSFKLQDIFEYLYGYRPYNAHRAENDTITLLQCILKMPGTFYDYLVENSVPLENF